MIQFNFKSEYLVACRKQREGEQMITTLDKPKTVLQEIKENMEWKSGNFLFPYAHIKAAVNRELLDKEGKYGSQKENY